MCHNTAHTKRYSSESVTCAIFQPIQKGTAIKRKRKKEDVCHNTALTDRNSINSYPPPPQKKKKIQQRKGNVCHIPTHTGRYSSERVMCAIFQPIQEDTSVKRIVCYNNDTSAPTTRRNSDLYTDRILRRQLRRKCSLRSQSHRETQDDADMVVGGGGRAWGV